MAGAAAASQLETYVPNTSEAVSLASTDYTPTISVRAVWVSVGGNIVFRYTGDSSDRTANNVPGGAFFVGAFSVIRKTNTTATIDFAVA